MEMASDATITPMDEEYGEESEETLEGGTGGGGASTSFQAHQATAVGHVSRKRNRYDEAQRDARQLTLNSDSDDHDDQEPEGGAEPTDGLDESTPSVTPADAEDEFASAVVEAFAAREAEIAAQPDVDEDDVRWAELALELVDRATLHLQSLPGMVTHKMRAQAVELARTDVDDARDICTDLRMPRYLQSDLLYRLAAAESALARL
jgi:hypothetical protein